MNFLICFLGILVWTIASIIWFFKSVGIKDRMDKWYDYLLSPPVLFIAFLFGIHSRYFNR